MKIIYRIRLWANRKRSAKIGRGLLRLNTPEKVREAIEADGTVIPRAEELYRLMVERANLHLKLGEVQEYRRVSIGIRIMNGHIYNLKQAASA